MKYPSLPTLNKISTGEYFNLPFEEQCKYDAILCMVKPVHSWNHIQGQSLYTMAFGDVERLKLYLRSGTAQGIVNAMASVYSITHEEVLELPVEVYYALYNWVVMKLRDIVERENTMLAPTKNNEVLKEAGVEKLAALGTFNATVPIGERFSKSPYEVEAMKYIEVFSIRLYYKFVEEISENVKNITNRNKPK